MESASGKKTIAYFHASKFGNGEKVAAFVEKLAGLM